MPSQLDNPPGWQEPLIDLRTGLVAPRWRPFLSRLTAVAQAGSENWTTAQRPTGNALWVGRTGYNTTLSKLESWDGSAWQTWVDTGLIEPLTLTETPAGTPAANTLYKDNIPKAWGMLTTSGLVVTAGFNVSSIAKNSTGDYTITWTVAFSSTNYAVVAVPEGSPSETRIVGSGRTTTSVRLQFFGSAGAATDPTIISVVAFGAQ